MRWSPAAIPLVLVASVHAFADDAKHAVAVRALGRIDIDGRLTEASWASAPPQQGFWQLSPHEGAPPVHDTTFRVLYDDDAIYVGVRAFDDRPDAIRGMLTRRDQDSTSDWITVSIDSYGDHRTAFAFSLNAAGVQHDERIFDDVQEDVGWDAVWEGATSIDTEGWIAEYRIPFSQLRFAHGAEQAWRMEVQRFVQRTQETTFWTAVPSDRDQLVSQFAPVTGIREVRPVRRIELVPYALTGVELTTSSKPLASAGLDVKYGVTSDFTISAALDPDFRQVEADPAVVNLTDREAFLPEKRPFFLEGADILRFPLTDGVIADPSEQMLYTRRIGAPPHVDVPGDDSNTTIYGAAALSGKAASGLSIGALSVVTAEERRRAQLPTGALGEMAVEPLTSFNVLRVGRDLNDGRTTVGAIVTGVFRRLQGTDIDTLHDRAVTAGTTLQHRSTGGAWTSSLKLMGSDVHGSPTALDLTQRASPHYFQRPDAAYLHYDPTRVHLSGFGASATSTFAPSRYWRLATGFDARSPGLELNDIGFQLAADYASPWVWIQYRDEVAGDFLQRASADVQVRGNYDWSRSFLGSRVDVNGSATLRSLWGVYAGATLEADSLDTKLLRGGPAVTGRDRLTGRVGLFSDERRRVHMVLESTGLSEPSSASWQASASANVVIAPRSNLELALGPTLLEGTNGLQYVNSVVGSGGGTHHVLARVHQVIASLTLRAAYTLSPRLSLQMYAQPFIATGRFDQYKEVVAPRARALDEQFHTFTPGQVIASDDTIAIDSDGDGAADLTTARPDFNVRELHSTLVVRWEYHPGSTFFLIWTHDRTGTDANRMLELGDNLQELARERGVHTVLVKLSYWWSP